MNKLISKNRRHKWRLYGLFFLLIATPLHADVTDGLVAWWKLDEGSGTSAVDSSGQGNTGTLTNGPTWVSGKRGGAVSLDGVNDYINISDSSSLYLNNVFTISVWFYDNNVSLVRPIISKDVVGVGTREWGCWVNSSKLYIEVGTNGDSLPTTVTANTTLLSNVWYHAVFIYNGTNIEIYLNGNQDKSPIGFTGPLFDTNQDIRIGSRSTTYFNGSIDDVRIYNRALSQAEIKAIYLSGSPKIIVNGSGKISGMKMN